MLLWLLMNPVQKQDRDREHAKKLSRLQPVMSTQIDNLVTSFNEILLSAGNLFDDLYTDKTSNLILPNNNRSTTKLNDSIKRFDHNLNEVLIQLNDVSLFKLRLNERLIEKKKLEEVKSSSKAENEVEQVDSKMDSDNDIHAFDPNTNDFDISYNNDGFNDDNFNDNNLLNEINDFLSAVPDATDLNISDRFNDPLLNLDDDSFNNVSDLKLNLADPLLSTTEHNNSNNFDSNKEANTNTNTNTNNNTDTNTSNNNDDINDVINNRDMDSNIEFDSNLFNEIDSMLNI